jgi:hypothetical protein
MYIYIYIYIYTALLAPAQEIQKRVEADATHAAATLRRRVKPSTVQDFDFMLQGLQSACAAVCVACS